MDRLLLLFGDQLDAGYLAHAALDRTRDGVMLAEVGGESTHVPSHVQRTVLFLAAMRHFAAAWTYWSTARVARSAGGGTWTRRTAPAWALVRRARRRPSASHLTPSRARSWRMWHSCCPTCPDEWTTSAGR